MLRATQLASGGTGASRCAAAGALLSHLAALPTPARLKPWHLPGTKPSMRPQPPVPTSALACDSSASLISSASYTYLLQPFRGEPTTDQVLDNRFALNGVKRGRGGRRRGAVSEQTNKPDPQEPPPGEREGQGGEGGKGRRRGESGRRRGDVAEGREGRDAGVGREGRDSGEREGMAERGEREGTPGVEGEGGEALHCSKSGTSAPFSLFFSLQLARTKKRVRKIGIKGKLLRSRRPLNQKKKGGGERGKVKLQGTEEENHMRVTLGTQQHIRQEHAPLTCIHNGQITQNMQRDEHTYYDLADHIKRDGHVVSRGM